MDFISFEEYVESTDETAVYPEDQELYYITLGLNDEIDEFCDKLYEYVDQDNSLITAQSNTDNGNLLERRSRKLDTNGRDELMDELGDVTWYLARFARALELEDWTVSNVYNDQRLSEAYKLADNMRGKAAKISGNMKKIMRDYGGDIEDEEAQGKVEAISQMVVELLNDCQTIAHCIGCYNLQIVFMKNIDKLFDRQERGVLKGDGDNR